MPRTDHNESLKRKLKMERQKTEKKIQLKLLAKTKQTRICIKKLEISNPE